MTWGVSDLNREWSFALAFRVFATPESPCISARPCSRRPAQVVLCIMGELQRAGVGEMHPVAAAQPANLAFEIRALHCVLSLIIDEAVPDIDIGDTGFIGSSAIKLV